ncbi:hypothetical protein EI94DRAFT_1737968 [Lactarius quietus]|nr:hypothetical protein EI94DRAFT_1737968 [Lactarius quietus]
MSTYTPCFPPHPLVSSTSSGSSDAPRASFSARLSKAHLALASVSEYIERPPSPTSAAVDPNHVAELRRRFRLARKWAHVSELAKLGCTIGRWQGPQPSTGDRNNQGVVDGPRTTEVNPYPRPPVPIFDLGEIRERIENWKATVVSAPLSQKSDIAKGMKRKRKASSDRDYTTSRYFRGDGLADRMSLEAQAVNRNAECVTPAPRSVARRSNAELTPQSRADSRDEDPETMHRRSSSTPAVITAPVPENIHQIAEAFLPPSFPSQLQTSTPPPCDRLIKPPVIPRAEGLFLSASLPSPPPFPRSQLDPGAASQPPFTPAHHTRARHDIPSPTISPSFKRRLQATATMAAPEKPPSTRSESEPLPPHGDARRQDLDTPSSPTGPALPLIDLHQLASQRSRDSHPSRMFALGSSPMTPGLKGKGRAMTMDVIPPRRTKTLSRALSSPPLFAQPQTQTPPLSPPPDFTFAPVATSTQQQQPPVHGSQRGTFGLEALVPPRGSGVGDVGVDVDVDVDVDGEGWVRDVPVVEADGDVDADGGGAGVSVGVGVGEEKGAGQCEGEKGPGLGLGLGQGQVLRISASADEHV